MLLHSNPLFEEFPVPYLSTTLPKEADVIIVGGGLTGLVTLYFLLAHTKLDAYLLEEGSLGYHASGRNIGAINLLDQIIEREKIDPEYLKVVKQSHDALACIIGKESLACNYHKAGGIYVSATSKGLSSITSKVDLLSPFWVKTLNAEEASIATGSSLFNGGMYLPGDSTLNSFKLVHSMANLCENTGRRVLTNAAVDNVTQTLNGFNIHVKNRGIVSAKNVVYCTGAYSNKIVPGINQNLRILKQHLALTQPIPEGMLDKLPRTSIYFDGTIFRILNNSLCIQTSPVLMGDRFNDNDISPRACDTIRKFIRQIYPDLAKLELLNVWGLVSCSGQDGKPLAGQIRPNEFINIGNSIGTVALTCIIVKDLIAGIPIPKELEALFAPGRFRNV